MNEMNIREIQESINKKEISLQELGQFYLDQIEKFQDYHAVITVNDKLMDIAKEQDLRLQNGDKLGRLFGVFILLKDNIATDDMPFTAGAKALEGTSSSRNAFLVDKLLEEDAIILGKANLSEWANYMSEPSSNGFSVMGGQTKNAYGDYDAGGSSSGSAVGVALNMCSVSIGSETCGSLLYPASVNSITTIKPSLGLISRDLVVPITEAQDTLGPMGRSLEDIWDMMKVCIKADPSDPKVQAAYNFKMSDFDRPLDKDILRGKRLGLVKSYVYDEEKKELDRTKTCHEYNRLVEELEGLDCQLVELDIDQENVGIEMEPVLDYGIVNDVNTFLNQGEIHSKMTSLEEIVAFNQEDPESRMPYGQKHFEKALENQLSKDDYEALRIKNKSIGQDIINKVYEDNKLDLLVSLVTDLSVIYSVAGYPAVIVPGGYTDKGLPYGVTFVGRYNEDASLLRYGYSYEQLTLHRLSPKKQKV